MNRNRSLTPEQARAIRDEYTGRYGCQTRLAKKYGVTQATIRQILIGKNYKEVLHPGEQKNISGRILRDELPNCVWGNAATPFCDNY